MIPYGRQRLDQNDRNAVLSVLSSDWLTQGPKIAEFEKALVKYCGVKYAVVVSHGTAALHLAYLAAGLKTGDEVITTPNTFAATANMILAAGAQPVFCDIRLDTYNLDETKLEKLVTKKTRAIVPVHFAGQSCEMNEILRIARKQKLLVIEDACHALGGSYRGKKIGSLKSDMTVFSFHAVKAITTGEGGAVLTNNKNYYKKLLLLRSHGIYKDQQGKNVMVELGYNYRLTDIQAALGISQLQKLDKFIRLRNQVANWYWEDLKDLQEIILPNQVVSLRGPFPGRSNPISARRLLRFARNDKHDVNAWHLYVIRVENPKLRDRLWQYLLKNGIGANFHYPAVYRHPYYQKIGYRKAILPNTEVYHHSCLTLPCHPAMQSAQVKHIGRTIRSFFEKHASID